jgi:hypothetical protein
MYYGLYRLEKQREKSDWTMKINSAPSKEESARLVSAMRDEDIDASDMPDRGGAEDWRRWKDRAAAFNKRDEHPA